MHILFFIKEAHSVDASGARTITSSGTSLTVYAFGLEEHVYNGTGSNVSNTYYYTLGGRLIGKFDGTNTQYYLTDAQGSVLTTFSNAVNTTSVSGYQAYGPYGNKLASSGSMSTAKGFTGQYQDPTGLDYYNARYYDPVIGCFTSADVKQGNAQGMDPYAYVNGNPETLTDPTGQTVSHCHEPGDCGPGSYTTDVSGGDTGSGGVVVGQDGSACTGSCDGPVPHVQMGSSAWSTWVASSTPKPRTPVKPPSSGNPKIKTSHATNSSTNSGHQNCTTSACIQHDLDIITARQQLRDTIGGDGVSLTAYLASALIDITSETAELLDLANIVLGIGNLVTDFMSWYHHPAPAWLTNALTYAKFTMGFLNAVANFLPFLGGLGTVLRGFKSVFSGLGNEIGQLVSSAGGLGGGLINIGIAQETIDNQNIPPSSIYQKCLGLGGENCE